MKKHLNQLAINYALTTLCDSIIHDADVRLRKQINIEPKIYYPKRSSKYHI